MGDLYRTLQVFADDTIFVAPFILVVACILLWIKNKSLWTVIATLGAVISVVGDITRTFVSHVTTYTILGGFTPSGDTSVIKWLAFRIFYDFGLFISLMGILMYVIGDFRQTRNNEASQDDGHA